VLLLAARILRQGPCTSFWCFGIVFRNTLFSQKNLFFLENGANKITFQIGKTISAQVPSLCISPALIAPYRVNFITRRKLKFAIIT